MGLMLPALLFAVGNLLVFILLYRGRKQDQLAFRAAIATSLLSITVALSVVLPIDLQLAQSISQIHILTLLAGITIVIFGQFIFTNLKFQPRKKLLQQVWYFISIVWLISYTIANLNVPSTSEPIAQSMPVIVALCGVGLSGIYLAMILVWNVHHVTLPDLANRSAYWIVISVIMTVGSASIVSGIPLFVVPGLLFLFLGNLGMTYGYTQTQILNVRHGLRLSAQNTALLTLLTTAILAPIYLADRFNLTTTLSGLLTAIAFATILAAVTLLVLQLISKIFANIAPSSNTNLPMAVTVYTHEVSHATSLDDVVSTTTETINKVLQIKRSSLILINETFRKTNAVEFVVLANESNRLTYVSTDSPIYTTLSQKRHTFTQYDLDFDPIFASVSNTEREFFQSLYLRAYAPIVTENKLIGVIGCGPKHDGTSFTQDELQLLTVIGQQVGTALRSARLIDDLRHLNTSMSSLNSQLQVAKQDLEKLDGIKTDFVTIASHELRTPLAQVRGYTDIIDSLNDQGILDEKQTKTLVTNLRRATERMEELISAMMDVSQLDVNSMDLNLVSTKPDTIIRLAIDPLRDAIEQRNLNVEIRDLSSLPHIQADMQRIVQAFSNIIVNAIKFTPNGGEIEISGKTETQDDEDHILLAIKDSGVGIKSSDLELIFQKFYRGFDPQLHSTGTYKFMGAGPGLGTTIAKGIIEGHGGKIWAESTGHDMEALPGSTFFISMPVKPPDDARRILPIDQESDVTSQAISALGQKATIEATAVSAEDLNQQETKKPNQAG